MRDRAEKGRLRQLRSKTNEELPAYRAILAKELISDSPDYGPAYVDYAIALIELARYEEAEQILTKAIELCPEEHLNAPYCQFGHLYKFKGDLDKAAEWFTKCVGLKPEDATYQIFLGAIYFGGQAKLEEAEKCFRKATACPEGYIDEAYLNLGFVLRSQERFEEALECFQKALEIDPEYKEAKLAIKDVSAVISHLGKKE